MRLPLLLFFLLSVVCSASAQSDTTYLKWYDSFRSSQRYAVNPWVSVPLIAGAAHLGQVRLLSLQDKPPLDVAFIESLRKEDVNRFDRIAVRRDFDKQKQALIQSGYFFDTGQWAPLALFVWKKYRHDWLDISLMYLEAQATQGLFYGYAPFGPTVVDRLRPVTYYSSDTETERLTDGNNRNSMFSGHVSTMSTGVLLRGAHGRRLQPPAYRRAAYPALYRRYPTLPLRWLAAHQGAQALP